MCFVRHIQGIRHHLHDPLASKFIDTVEVNNVKTIERARSNRLAQVKVGLNNHLPESGGWGHWGHVGQIA